MVELPFAVRVEDGIPVSVEVLADGTQYKLYILAERRIENI